MQRILLLSLALPALLLAASCGDDDAPSGTGTDEDYLRAICAGTNEFSDALVSKTTAAEIGEVIKDFIDAMKKTNPPADLVQYNREFIQYLQDALDDPTSLVTRQPPLPPDDVQKRLAAKELSVEECRDGSFFSRGTSD